MSVVRGLSAPLWIVCVALLNWLGGCVAHHAGDGGDHELTAATASAQLAFSQGKTALAAQLFAGALARARAMDNSAEIADAAYNLAACLIEMGQYQGARDQLDEAEAESIRAGKSGVDVLLVKAMLARLRKRPAEAVALAEQVLHQRPPATDTERAQAYLVKAEAACDTGDSVTAANDLQRMNPPTNLSPSLRARLAAARGQVDLLRKQWQSAAREFDVAADLMRQAHHYQSMSRMLADAGRAYQAAGRDGDAADDYYRAGRSAYGLGDANHSLEWIAEARAAAIRAGKAELEARATALSAEIRAAAAARP